MWLFLHVIAFFANIPTTRWSCCSSNVFWCINRVTVPIVHGKETKHVPTKQIIYMCVITLCVFCNFVLLVFDYFIIGHIYHTHDIIRKVWRCQWVNQKPYIEEDNQCNSQKEKAKNDKQRSTKTIYRKLKNEHQNSTVNRGWTHIFPEKCFNA